nr:MAG TPA: hypothetical protein [Caudoviricetes sp.]
MSFILSYFFDSSSNSFPLFFNTNYFIFDFLLFTFYSNPATWISQSANYLCPNSNVFFCFILGSLTSYDHGFF